MDLDQTFRKCLLLWAEKHEGKGSFADFQDIVLQNDHNGLWRKVFLTRFYCLCSGEDDGDSGIVCPDYLGA